MSVSAVPPFTPSAHNLLAVTSGLNGILSELRKL
jgi:hypothetical protein